MGFRPCQSEPACGEGGSGNLERRTDEVQHSIVMTTQALGPSCEIFSDAALHKPAGGGQQHSE